MLLSTGWVTPTAPSGDGWGSSSRQSSLRGGGSGRPVGGGATLWNRRERRKRRCRRSARQPYSNLAVRSASRAESERENEQNDDRPSVYGLNGSSRPPGRHHARSAHLQTLSLC